jgi:hypothetical protein
MERKRMWKTLKVMKISNEPSPVQIMIDQKELANVDYCNYMCSMITKDERCTREIKSKIALILFTSKMDFTRI